MLEHTEIRRASWSSIISSVLFIEAQVFIAADGHRSCSFGLKVTALLQSFGEKHDRT